MSEKPRLMFIDYSSIAHPIYHATINDPRPNAMSIDIIAKVRALASGQPHVALCLDSRKSFRKELDATYKAGRESKPEPFWHQYRLALETLRGDGFPLWEAESFEADDVVATAVEQAKVGGWHSLVCSSDKDLLALVSPSVHVKSVSTGAELDEAAVREKFGVDPHQIMDYLTIVGDASDGVVGVRGIGSKGASALLAAFGNLDDLYAAIDNGGAAVKPAQLLALNEFRSRLPVVRQLIALRTDATIDFAAVLKERVPMDVATFGAEDDIMRDLEEAMPTVDAPEFDWKVQKPQPQELTGEQATDALGAFAADVARRVAPIMTPRPMHIADKAQSLREQDAQVLQSTPMQVQQETPRPSVGTAQPEKPSARSGGETASGHSTALVPVVVDYERQLEPRTLSEAKQLAQWAFESRLFSAFGTPQAVMTTILAGREIGLSAMASLRGFMIVDGKPSMSADLIRALVQRSTQCEYFRCLERTAEQSTWATKRKGEPDEQRLTFTLAEGRAAWQKDQRAWDQSNWGKRPANMVAKTASSMLARLVYADVVMNLYCAEEMDV